MTPERKPVSELCELIVDCVNRTAPVVDFETPFRMIRTTNVRNGRVNLDGAKNVTEETFAKWTRRAKVLDGDVILTREAPIGEVGYVKDLGHVFLGQRIMQYRPDPKVVNPRYFYYAFRSKDLQHQFGAHDGSGSVVSHIRVGDCHKFEMTIPNRERQNSIVDLLGSLDDKIELNRRMNETLEEIARALFRDWFVDFGPTRRQKEGATDPGAIMGGAFPAEKAAILTPFFPATLGENGLPEGWEDRPLSELTSLLKRGATPKYAETGCLVVNQKCIRNNAINYKLARRNDLSLRDPKLKELQIGDVLVNSTGVGTLGRVATVRVLPERAMADTHVSIVRPDPDLIQPIIVALMLETMQDRIADMGHGSTGQTELRPSVIGEIHATIACREIQNSFAEAVGTLRKKVDANEQENQTLAEMRDLLLPKLMSGEIRVGDVEATR